MQQGKQSSENCILVFVNWELIIVYLPHLNGDVAQLARALAWHARGRGFDSHLLHR